MILWAIKALRDEPLPLFAAAAEREMLTIAEQLEPDVVLKQVAQGHNVIEDYSHPGLPDRTVAVISITPKLTDPGAVKRKQVFVDRRHVAMPNLNFKDVG